MGCNEQHGDYSYNTVLYLKVAKKGDLKRSYHKKKNQPVCGDGC